MNVLFLTINRFSDGSAGSEREIVLGKLLRSLGYNVFFCTLDEVSFGEVHVLEDFEYVSFRKSGKSSFQRALNYFYYKKNLEKLLNIKFATDKPKQIFVTDIPFNTLEFVIKYAKKNNIGLVHNSVEWYSPDEFKYGRFSANYILNYLLNTTFIHKPFKVIGISNYLTDYFKDRGIQSLRIPYIVDTESIKCDKKCLTEKLVLLYAGNAGRKDYLKEMIEGLSMLSRSELDRIEFRIFGVSYDSLINDCNVAKSILEKSKFFINLYGRVPRQEILAHLQEAHFTLLLRSDKLRYAKAGFPTKVTESLSTGTPVISNLTSDLELYLQDGINGLIVPSYTAEAFAQTIRRALLLKPNRLSSMQVAARRCAENQLDYRIFSKKMEAFLLT